MSSFAGDLQLSAAGIEDGHAAFQEFLLAGERHIVAGLARPGTAEARFAQLYSELPDSMQNPMAGYFRRQAQLDLSQRVALLGDLTKLAISDPLTSRTIDMVRGTRSTSSRSERDSFGPRLSGNRGAAFSTITGTIADALADAVVAGENAGIAPRPPEIRVRRVELLLEEITVEDSQDYVFIIRGDTDETSLGVTMISDIGAVTTEFHKLGSISEGNSRTFKPPLVLGSLPVAAGTSGFPRTFTFKVDAVERDDGGYNDWLADGADYIQSKVTEELIERGIIGAGGALGVPIPPVVAHYIASYVKAWFDDFIDWLEDIFKNKDDILGSKARSVELNSLEFELTEKFFLFGTRTVSAAKGPLQGSPFTWTYSGSDGRWRTKMRVQLR